MHMMEQCRCRHLSVGTYVCINVTSRPALNALVWEVVGHGQGDRMIVQATAPADGVPEGYQISVRCNSVSPLAVVPYVPGTPADPDPTSVEPEVQQLEQFVMASSHNSALPTDEWLQLPLLGGNAIMLTDTAPGLGQALIMYPRLAQYQLVFSSAWNGDEVLMMEWPWCAWCRKFLLPVMDHRNSKKHRSFRRQLMDKGPERIRLEAIANLQNTNTMY